LHLYPYSSKFPPLPREAFQQFGGPVADQCRDGAGGCCEHELRTCSIRDSSLASDGGRQHASEPIEHGDFLPAAVDERGELSLGGEKIA